MKEHSAVPLALEPAIAPARGRRRLQAGRHVTPYLLLIPALVVIGGVLGYPLYRLVTLSFQEYGLPELIAHKGKWIGLDNYQEIFGDRWFWTVLGRTIAFTAVTVGLTMLFGTLIALLLQRLGTFMRLLITTGLVLVWSMPPVVAVTIWSWMVDYEFGVLNWTLAQLGFESFAHHDWFVNPIQGWAIITAIIVWGAIPFVAITIFAGLTQVSGEMVEAASIDGAGRVPDLPRHHAADPEADLRHPREPVGDLELPGLQPDLDHPQRPARGRLLRAQHLLVRRVVQHEPVRARLGDRARDGAGDAHGHLRLHPPDGPDRGDRLSVQAHPAPPRRRRRRKRTLQRVGLNALGLLVFAVMTFPVYWMVSTSFKQGGEILSFTPQFIPTNPTLDNFRDAIGRDLFWSSVRNSLIVVVAVVIVSVVLAFLAALALAKFRFHGRSAFVVVVFGVQMVPLAALVIPLYITFSAIHQVDKLSGVVIAYVAVVLPFCVWTLRGFISGIPKELEEAAMVDGSTRLGAFVRILLPLVGPGLVATSIFAFIQAWNEYIIAYVMLSSADKQTITIWLANFITGTTRGVDWGTLMAAATLTALPVVLFFVIVHRRIAFGLTAGAVKQ